MLKKESKGSLEPEVSAKVKPRQIQELDLSVASNRKFLVDSFRELEKIVTKKYKFCPSDMFPDETLIQEIVNRSNVVEPYIVGDFTPQILEPPYYQRTHLSLMYANCALANRECSEPKIKIDGEVVFEHQNPNMSRLKKDSSVVSLFKNSSFLLSIEVEPNHSIMFTKNGKNPLLAHPDDRAIVNNSYSEKIQPPCTICAVALYEEYRLPSRVLTVVVKSNAAGVSQVQRQSGGIVRPDPRLEMDASRSNYSQIHFL